VSGFKKFLLRGNVVDLAVAVVMGAAFTSIVQAVVKGLITPLIGIFGGIPDFSEWAVTLGASRFAVGEVINALISFLVIAGVVYFLVVMPMNRLMERMLPSTPPTKTKECPFCLSKVPEKAVRCAFCTADLKDAVDTAVERIAGTGRAVGAETS
jgi:large conductance mechanosensitive channel